MSLKRNSESKGMRRSGDVSASVSLKTGPNDPRSRAYQTRWISKPRINLSRKLREFREAILVDYRTGFLIVEPKGSDLGDGDILPLEVADYELRTAWCQTPKPRLIQARRLLGLSTDPRQI
jgi:hypothetical protein